jgi:shikimate dehydrogenase
MTQGLKKNIIIGNPLEQSLSPQMHNFVYSKMGIDNEFIFLKKELILQELKDFVNSNKYSSLTVTIPFKETIIQYLNSLEVKAKKIGAVNTVVKKYNIQGDYNTLIGYNTDWLGGLIPIYEKISRQKFIFSKKEDLDKVLSSTFLKNKKVILFGSGGAARALAYAVLLAGADLYIVSRNIEKAISFKADLLLNFSNSLIQILQDKDTFLKSLLSTTDLIINSTPMGMGSLESVSPLDSLEENLSSQTILFDAVYKPLWTKFLNQGKAKKCSIINGLEMLVWQAVFQFQLQTNHFPKVEYFWESLDIYLKNT